MNIIGYRNDVRLDALKHWADKKGGVAEFTKLAEIYDKICKEMNCNQVVAYVQCAKETGFLYKNGSAAGLNASFHNPCGLKITKGGGDFDRSAHMVFDTWEDGIRAHIDHLLLYAGAEGYPKKDSLDPRHFPFLYGTAHNRVEELNDKWTSGPYGDKLVEMANEVLAITDEQLYPDSKIEDDEIPVTSSTTTVPNPKENIDLSHVIKSDINENDIFARLISEIGELTMYTELKSLIYYQLKPLFELYLKEKPINLNLNLKETLISYCNKNFIYDKVTNEYKLRHNIKYLNSIHLPSSMDCVCLTGDFIQSALIITDVFKDKRFDYSAFSALLRHISNNLNSYGLEEIDIEKIIYGG